MLLLCRLNGLVVIGNHVRKIDIIFETDDPDENTINMAMIGLSKLLKIDTQFLTGISTAHERLTIPLSNGKNLILQDGDCGSWIGVEH